MDVRRIDLNLLVVLEAIVAEGGVTRAARRLHLSQSAMSHALARLREAFGDPVLVRHGRAMEVTARAQAALPRVRAILSQAGRLFGDAGAFDPAAAQHEFHVGASDYAVLSALAPLLPRLREQAPAMRLHVRHAGRVDAPRLLRSGELDLALGVFNTLTADLASEPVLVEPYLCAMARGRGLRPPDSAQAWLDAAHLNVLVQGDTLGLIDEALAARGLSRRIVVTVPHFMAALQVLPGTDLVYTGPAGLLRNPAMARGLRVFEPPLTLPAFRTQQAWARRAEDDPALQWLRQQIRQGA